MEFDVRFTTADGEKPLVEKLGQPGIDILDHIRETYPQIKNLASKDIRFYDQCPIDGSAITIRLTEEEARKSGLFKGRTTITVLVPEASFSRFVDISLEEYFAATEDESYLFPMLAAIPFLRWVAFKRTNEADELYRAEVKYQYKDTDIINKWIEDGCPLEWCL